MTEFIDPLGRGPKIVARPPSPPPQPPPNFSSPMDTKFRPTMDAKPMFPDAAFESDQRVPPPPPPSQQQHHQQAVSRGPPPPSASMASSSQYYPPVQQQWSGQIGANHGSGGFPPRSNLGNRVEEDAVPPSPMQIYLDRRQRSHPSASFDRSAGSSSTREKTSLVMDGRAPKITSSSNLSSQYPSQHGSYNLNHNYQDNGNVFRDQRDFSSHNSHTVPARSFDRNSIRESSMPPAANNASLQSPQPSNYFPHDRPHHPSHQPHSHPQGHQPHHHPQREPYYDRGERDDPTRRGTEDYYPPSSSDGNRNHHHVPSRNGFESPPLPPATSRSVPPPTSRSAPLHDGHPRRGPHSATNRSHPDARYYSREYGEQGPPPPPPLSERNDRPARLPGVSNLSYGDSYNRESGQVTNTNNGYHNGPIDDDHRGNDRFWPEGRGDGSGNYRDSDPYRGGDAYDARRAPSEDRFRSPPVPARDDCKREYPPREFDRERRPPPLNSRSREDYYGAEYDRQRDPMHPHHQQQRGSFDSKLPHHDHRFHSEYRPGIDERNHSGHVDERYRYDNEVQSNRHNDDRGRAPSPHVIDPTPLPPPQPPISPLTTATFCGTFADDYLPKSSCHSRDYDDREPNHRHSSSVDPYRGIARERDREGDRRSPYSDFACAPGDITSAGNRATTRGNGGVTDPRHYPHRRYDGGTRDYVDPSHSREHDYDHKKSSYIKHYEADHTRGIPKQVLAYQGQPSYSDHRSSRPDKRDDFSESSVQTHSSTSGRQGGPSSSDTYHHQHSHEQYSYHPPSHQHDDFDIQDKPHLRIEIPASPNLPNGNRVRQDVRSNSRSMESKPYTSNTNPRSQSQSQTTKQTINLPPKSPRIAMANEERHQSEARHQIMKEIRQATNMRNSALDEDDRRFWDRQIATLNESFKKL